NAGAVIGALGISEMRSQMTVSNGTWLSSSVGVSGNSLLTIAGGTNTLSGLSLGAFDDPNSGGGSVLMAGGLLVVSSGIYGNTSIGCCGGYGDMTVNGGTWLTQSMTVGIGSDGYLTVAGGRGSGHSS